MEDNNRMIRLDKQSRDVIDQLETELRRTEIDLNEVRGTNIAQYVAGEMHTYKHVLPMVKPVIQQLAFERDEARADVQRLKDYIEWVTGLLGPLPYDPTDTALIALLGNEGKDE